MNPNHLKPGYLLHYRYSIQKSLGQGGFGITYLAYDRRLDQEVCIKELFISGNSTRGSNMTVQYQATSGFSFPEFVRRFIEEARQLTRFNHPNIVRVIDVFQANNTAYTVMELVVGETLQQLVLKNGVLSEQVVIKLVLQLLDAVEEVHNKGILHRDIKPLNILVTPQGRLVLIDFGSSREFADGKTSTQTAMVSGGYAPPEQYSNRGRRGTYTDIYALGATIYFAVKGKKPIAATDRINEELVPPHKTTPKLSKKLSLVIMRAMDLKPHNRYQSVAEMRKAIKSSAAKKRKGWYVFLAFALILTLAGIYNFSPSLILKQSATGLPKMSTPVDNGPTDVEKEQEWYKQLEQQRQEEERKKRDQAQNVRSVIQQLENNMVYLDGGTFTMGCTGAPGDYCDFDEYPSHRVTLTSFYISKYEVTQAQWQAVMGSNPSKFYECDNCPVEGVSWDDVQIFIRKLNQITGKNYRLPTEAEWEYAARGGNNSRRYKYSGSNNIEYVAWYKGKSSSKTHPVGQKQSNELGLYDMSGNVWEWCGDWKGDYHTSSFAQNNPNGPSAGSKRVCRGGGWLSNWDACRVSFRLSNYPGTRINQVGFRLVSNSVTEIEQEIQEQYDGNQSQTSSSLLEQIQNSMVYISKGAFNMGCTSEQGDYCTSDEKPTHQVTVSSFYLSKFEITQEQWRLVMGSNPSYFNECDNCPIENVSWNDAQEFIHKLNKMTGKSYRLPTEAEWEYAARGGNNGRGYQYCGSYNIRNVAWYKDNSGNKTHPVGQKQPNELGLYDMSGNVSEWCSDRYGLYNNKGIQDNPKGSSSGLNRVRRGGNWSSNSQKCRVSYRYGINPGIRFSSQGLRLATDALHY